MKHKKLSTRILSLVLTAAMVGTMMPQAVLAAEGDSALGTSSTEKTTRTITAFDELGEGYTKSVPFDGHTYALTVKLGTPIEEIVLPTELGVTVEKTTTTATPPAKDEVKDDVVDSGEAPKDTAPADEPINSESIAESEDKTVAETPAADESASTEPAAQVADTDTTVSGNEPASPSDAEQAPLPEEKPDEDVPPAEEPEQDKESTVTETAQKTIPVTWTGDREYTPDQNSKVIYTPVLPEGYALKDGVALPTIYVFVGKQARAGEVKQRTIPLDLTSTSLSYAASDGTTKIANPTTESITGTIEGWSWNFSSNTLTLNGATIESGDHFAVKLPDGATIDASGTNTLNMGTLNATYSPGIINGEGKLSIKGTGTINAKGHFVGGGDNLYVQGIYTVGSLKIDGVTLNVVLTTEDTANTRESMYAIRSAADITIGETSAANVDVTALGYFYEAAGGLKGRNGFIMTDGNLSIKSSGGPISGNAEIKGGVVTLQGEGKANSATFTANGATIIGSSNYDGSDAQAVTIAEINNTSNTYKYVQFSFGPSITVGAQSGAATYGAAAAPTFAVTNSNFGGLYPAFVPRVAWTNGNAPTDVTTVFTDSNAKLTMNTTTATPVGEYKFKVVSAKTGGGNYQSAEATLEVDKREATITWGPTTSFPYTGSAQAPTATVSNKVGSDVVTVTVTGGETAVGSYTATADALDGTAAGNYAMPSTKPTKAFSITKASYIGTVSAPSGTPASKSDTSITLAPVTAPSGETVQYGIKKSDGTIDWQDSPTFTSLTADTEYTFFARVKETTNHEAGPASGSTKIKTDLSNAQKVEAAKIAVENALNNFTATNATNADKVMAAVNKALTDAGITGVNPSWDASGAFGKTSADEDNAGSVTGKIKLTCGSESDTVTLNKTIAQLPSDSAGKVRLVKAAIEEALNTYTATNATTAADIKAVADKANTDTGVIGVTVAWKTPSDFNNKNSTNSENGKVTGTFDLSCTKGGSTATGTVSVNCPIERSDEQKLKGAIANANNAKIGIVINNGSPSSVASGTKFVSDAEMKALTDAIAAAQTVADKENATAAELTEATNALNTAVDTFKKAIKTGTYTSGSGSSSSSGGGGSSSGGNTPGIVPPNTKQPNPPTTVEAEVPATVDNKGNANVNVTDKTMQDAIDKAVAKAKKNGTSGNGISIVISVTTGGKDANTVTINLPKTVQEKVIAGKVLNTVVVVDRPDISINMNLATIKEINKQAKSDVQISATRMDNRKLSGDAKKAIGNHPTFDLKATYASGTKAVTSFGTGNVTVGIPYTLQASEVASGLYAVYVDGNGKATHLTNSSYDAETKMLRFSTNHFSVYGIGYKAPAKFTDIANHWAKSDIEFVVNRGLLNGTSATTFSPDGAMTRGMFVTALGRLAGIDVNAYKTNKFTDVKKDAYYAPYANWAASKGITNGTTATTFAPDAAISRQEMAVMMSNYAKALGYTVPQTRAANTFADNANIARWAADAVKQMQMAGILNGKNSNKFDPTGTATRGEISAMLRRYVELTIDRATTEGWTINDSGSSMYYQKGKALTGSRLIGTTTYVFNNYGETTSKTNIAGATTIAVAL